VILHHEGADFALEETHDLNKGSPFMEIQLVGAQEGRLSRRRLFRSFRNRFCEV
jgi:hypothetical protein